METDPPGRAVRVAERPELSGTDSDLDRTEDGRTRTVGMKGPRSSVAKDSGGSDEEEEEG